MSPVVSKKASAAAILAEQCRRLDLPVPTHYGSAKEELKFHPTRNWRLDVAWTGLRSSRIINAVGTVGPCEGPKLALEIDGGVFAVRNCPKCYGRGGACAACFGTGKLRGGRHNTGAGFRDDIEKYSEAMILGWYVFRCLPEQITQGVTVTFLERFFFAHHVLLPRSPRPRRSYPNDTTK